MKVAFGNVLDRPWGQTLGTIGIRKLTAQVTVRADDGKAYTIAFVNGDIAAAVSPLPNDSVTRVALTSHFVSPLQVNEITRRLASEKRDEVEIVAEAGKLSADHTATLRRRLVMQRAARTFAIDRGGFEIDDTLELPVRADFHIPLGAAIYQGVRMNLSDQRLAEDLRELGSSFLLRSTTTDDDIVRFDLGFASAHLIDALRRGATLAELENTHRDVEPRTMHSMLYALVCSGVCDASGGQAVDRTAPPAPRTSTGLVNPVVSHTTIRVDQPLVARAVRPSTAPATVPRTMSGDQPEIVRSLPRTMSAEHVEISRTMSRDQAPDLPRTLSQQPPPQPGRTSSGSTPPATRTTTTSTIPPRTTTPTVPPRAASPTIPSRTITPTVPPRTTTPTSSPPRTTTPTTPPSRTSSPTITPPALGRTSTTGPRPIVGARATTPPDTKRSGSLTTPGIAALSQTPALSRTITAPRTITERDRAAKEIETLIATRLAKLEQQVDYFTILGVPFEAPAEAVRSAFIETSRKLHPDSLAQVGIDDDAKSAQRLMAQITTAYQTLSDPQKRRIYIDACRRGEPTPISPRARTGDLDKTELAAEAFENGEIALKREDIPRAVEELGRAVTLAPQNFDYLGLFAWARFCLAVDKQSIYVETRKSLEKAINRATKPVTARFYLGRVERILGHDREALNHFQEVLLDEPNNKEAASELRVLERKLSASRPKR